MTTDSSQRRSDDPKLKYGQLQVWREQFKAEHKGKEPMVWIDKVGRY